jgi:hypothetical protein
MQRSSWRDSDLTVTGDAKLAARLPDAVNVNRAEHHGALAAPRR